MSLLSSILFVSPGFSADAIWPSPGAVLILLPAALIRLFASYDRKAKAILPSNVTSASLAIVLATTTVILGWEFQIPITVAVATLLVSFTLEVGRTGAWSRIGLTPIASHAASLSLPLLIIFELVSVTLSIYCFYVSRDTMLTVEALRISSLIVMAALFYNLLGSSPRKIIQSLPSISFKRQFGWVALLKLDEGEKVKSPRLRSLKAAPSFEAERPSQSCLAVHTAIAGNIIGITLLPLLLSHREMASGSWFSLLLDLVIGMLFGAIYWLVMSLKACPPRELDALLLSCLGCSICIAHPSGLALSFGLALSGFAASLLSAHSFYHSPLLDSWILIWGLTVDISAAFAFSYIFMVTHFIETHIDVLSISLLVRLLGLSQLTFLVVTFAASCIIKKYRQS